MSKQDIVEMELLEESVEEILEKKSEFDIVSLEIIKVRHATFKY